MSNIGHPTLLFSRIPKYMMSEKKKKKNVSMRVTKSSVILFADGVIS